MHGPLAPLRRRLENPLDTALAKICFRYHILNNETEDSMLELLTPDGASFCLQDKVFFEKQPYLVLAAAVDRYAFKLKTHLPV